MPYAAVLNDVGAWGIGESPEEAILAAAPFVCRADDLVVHYVTSDQADLFRSGVRAWPLVPSAHGVAVSPHVELSDQDGALDLVIHLEGDP